MESDYLSLKRASTSRPSGEWDDDDFEVLANGVVVGRISNAGPVGSSAPQHVELVSKDKDLGLQRSPRPDGPIEAHQLAKIAIGGASISRFAAAGQPFWVCGRDTPRLAPRPEQVGDKHSKQLKECEHHAG